MFSRLTVFLVSALVISGSGALPDTSAQPDVVITDAVSTAAPSGSTTQATQTGTVDTVATVAPSGSTTQATQSGTADTVSTAASPSSTTTMAERVSTGWYAGWHAKDFPLNQVSWDKYTQLTYAFGMTTPNPAQIDLMESDVQMLPRFVSTAQSHGVKASLSIGGWTGSRFFSVNVGSEENRTAFVKAVSNIATEYKLDGIDFDWEYPGRQGLGCNTISPNDTSNFLTFLQALRKTSVGSKLTLSAAVSVKPFNTSNGPSTDVSGFAKVLDYVAIMNYDLWGSFSTAVGPNAPYDDTCAAPANQQGSAVSAVRAWSAAGMPLNKIVLGVAAYGHSFSVAPSAAFVNGSDTALKAYPVFDKSAHPIGDRWDGPPSVNACGVSEPQGGVWDFWGLIEGGFLSSNGSVTPGILSRFDECSLTAYVYNKTSQVMVSYDNAKAFNFKGLFIKEAKLRGFAVWQAGGDSHNILIDSIRAGAGF